MAQQLLMFLKFPYNEMVQEWTGAWVHTSEYEPKHPQLEPLPIVTDPQSLQHAKPESKKEVAAKKILKKMGDKGRYDSANQLKTLIVMQVLGNSKSFFEGQQSLNDIEGFFTDNAIPDAELTTNNIAQYFLFLLSLQ